MWRKVIGVVTTREVEPKEEEEEVEVEKSKTASFQIPTYSLVIIFQSNVEHTISANEHASFMSEFCKFCNIIKVFYLPADTL
jgi:coenzyme F420-reducing hydrogenase beta subunit